MQDILAVLSWWVIIQLIGLAAWPLAFRLLRFLPDRGYTAAKPLGLLLTSYVLWLFGSLGLVSNSLGGIAMALAIVIAASAYALSRDGFAVLREWFDQHRAMVLVYEALLIAAMFGWAAYLTPPNLANREAILEALRHCRRLTVTSMRLARLLEKYTQAPLTQKSLACPNAFEFPQAARKPAKPAGIILASSDNLPFINSRKAIIEALVGFTEKHHLPVYLFGREMQMVSRLRRVTDSGLVPYWHYHMLLAAWPPMIGIAPLETEADQETLDFFSGKTDVKMLEFGGFGHPSV